MKLRNRVSLEVSGSYCLTVYPVPISQFRLAGHLYYRVRFHAKLLRNKGDGEVLGHRAPEWGGVGRAIDEAGMGVGIRRFNLDGNIFTRLICRMTRIFLQGAAENLR